MEANDREMILILDFGGQYSHLIARNIRELKSYCEILPHHTSLERIKTLAPKGIILSGGPSSVYEDNAPSCDPGIYKLDIPVLGICYGMQLMSEQLGGKVSPGIHGEYGKTTCFVTDTSGLMAGLNKQEQCLMSHGDLVTAPPPGFKTTAYTEKVPVSVMEDKTGQLYAVQFHPEVDHTPKGKQILQNFVNTICKCSESWTMGSFLEESLAEIKDKAGQGKVLCGLSGGVDSSVAAVMVHEAIQDQLTCVFVDTGLLRKGEADQVRKTFQEQFHINLDFVDAKERFLTKLKGVQDPEKKRKIIGEEFIRVFEEEAAKIGQVDFLVQGTLYSDIVESGTATASVIKSHHNVGGLPEDMQFKLIEPLKWLFKDEVRRLGERLGIPKEIVWRQPFPGPGLGIRILGEITEEKVEILQEADAIVTQEIKRAGLEQDIWQSFAVLPQMKSVGVMGDKRTYSHTIAIRAVSSKDAMTADWVRLPYDILERISSRIVNEVPEVNRVVYDITSKPPSTIEWE